MALPKTFFYSPGIGNTVLAQLVQGIIDPPPDTIEFPDEAGGEAARELAIPLLRGMDEIQVSEAELRIRARPLETETHAYLARNSPDGKGVFLVLSSPGLLKKVTLAYTAPAPSPGKTMRLVIRAAQPQGSDFQGGVPLFVYPGLGALGPMYGPKLPEAGLTAAGGKQLVTLPSVMGSAWLFQLAEGDAPDELSPVAAPITIAAVTLDSIPKDVSVSLSSSNGDLVLWSHPGPLLPSLGSQVVSFAPLAQRHLMDRMKMAASDAVALAVALTFRSASPGVLEIESKSLRALYVFRPFGSEPKKLKLSGDRVPLIFQTPSGLSPASNSMRFTVKPKGRERDAASPESPSEIPVRGLQVNAAVYAAAGAPLSAAGPIAGARVLLQVAGSVEAVLEARADAAGSPGELLGKPSVRQLAAGPPGWVDFDFPQPIPSQTARIWLSLRTNQGVLFWYTDAAGSGTPKLSFDQGKSWQAPETSLGPTEKCLVQLIVPSGSLAAPAVSLRQGSEVCVQNLLAGAVSKAGDFSVQTSLPLNLLAAPPANGKTEKRFELVSAAIGDAVIDEFAIMYDPAA